MKSLFMGSPGTSTSSETNCSQSTSENLSYLMTFKVLRDMLAPFRCLSDVAGEYLDGHLVEESAKYRLHIFYPKSKCFQKFESVNTNSLFYYHVGMSLTQVST